MKKSSRGMILLALFSLMISYGNPVHAEEASGQKEVKVTYTVEEQESSATDKTDQSDGNAQLTPPNSQASEENQSSAKEKTEPKSSVSVEKTNQVEKKEQLKQLPQMNERKRIMSSLMGGTLLLFLGLVFVIKKKKEIK